MTRKQNPEHIFNKAVEIKGMHMFETGQSELLSRHALLIASTIAFLTFVAGCLSISDPSLMQIQTLKGKYAITAPYGKISLHIPKGRLSRKKFRQAGSSYNPNYFHFEDAENNLVVSGRFRSANGFPGIKTFWEYHLKEWKRKKCPIPQDVLFVDIGAWKVIIYDVTCPDGYGAHLSAHWLKEGKWIDLHLSMTSDQEDVGAKSRLLGLLRRMRVVVPEPRTHGGHAWHRHQRNSKKR